MGVYTFEYDGITIEYGRGTVETRMEGQRIVEKLLHAYGHVAGNPASDRDYDNMVEYANSMARTKKNDAPWWCDSNMLIEQVKERFELFKGQDEDLYNLYLTAARAMQALKKTMIKTPVIPPS